MQLTPTEFQPFGALGGFYAGQNAAALDEMRGLDLAAKGMENEKLALEAARAEAMNNDAALQQYKLAQLGQMDKQIAEGQFAQETNRGRIDAENVLNQVKINEAEKQELLQGVEGVISTLEASPNLAGLTRVMDMLPDPQIKQMLQALAQQGGPRAVVDYAKQFREQVLKLKADTAEHRNAMELQKAKDDAAYARTKYTADAATTRAINKAPSAETTDKAIARLSAIIADPAASPEDKAIAQEQLSILVQTKQETNPAMNKPSVDIGQYGVPTTTPAAQARGRPAGVDDPLGIR